VKNRQVNRENQRRGLLVLLLQRKIFSYTKTVREIIITLLESAKDVRQEVLTWDINVLSRANPYRSSFNCRERIMMMIICPK